MRLFFFGTLLDADVRRVVFGRTDSLATGEPATLRGFCRVHVRGRSYPMLMRRPAGQVAGLLIRSVDRQALRRIIDYEGPEYHLTPVTVMPRSGTPTTAATFLCRPGIMACRRPWRLADWQKRHKAEFIRRARTRRWIYREATSVSRSRTWQD